MFKLEQDERDDITIQVALHWEDLIVLVDALRQYDPPREHNEKGQDFRGVHAQTLRELLSVYEQRLAKNAGNWVDVQARENAGHREKVQAHNLAG